MITLKKAVALAALGMAVTTGALLLDANTGTAEAAQCKYTSEDSAGYYANAYGFGKASKMSTACDRARRECHRKLERAFEKGLAGRGAHCYKI